MSVNTGTDTWAESLARNPIELIDQARALVEALTDADNKGAASIVERLIDAYEDGLVYIETLGDRIADLAGDVADAVAEKGSSQRLQELENPLEALEEAARRLRFALNTSEVVPTVACY